MSIVPPRRFPRIRLPRLRPRRLAPALVLALAWLAPAPPVRAQAVRSDFVMTNGQVNAEIAWGGKLFFGGSFTNVGPRTGGGVPVDTTAGAIVPGFPSVAGQVNAVVTDGAGGWYVGGAFTSVGGQPRRNLAHVLADLSVGAWDPSPDQPVYALALRGGVLYAGGDFANVGGQPRSRIAALDTATAGATAWDPGADLTVRALVATDSVVYAGGDFANAGGQARSRIAALDVASGAATAWNPGSNGSIYALDAGGGVVYAGGFFSTIGGQSRTDLAALDAATGLATAWNPRPDNQVFTIVLAGARVYVGGAFTKFNLVTTRNRVAAIDVASGAAVATFDPNANGRVLALWAAGPVLYAGGEFTTVGGQPRTFVAAIDTLTGGATGWNPSAYGPVYALSPGGASLYVGGVFNGIGGAVRNNLAQVDLATGTLTAWNPNANGQVLALAPRGGTILVGGQFTSIGGQTRNNVAALDSTSGLATAWDPNANGQVSALSVRNGMVYLGGVFSSVGGQTRNNLAAVDTTLGAVSAWNPNVNGQIFTIVARDSAVYIGGAFSSVGAQSRHDVAAVSPTTALATAWDPNSNGTVRRLIQTCGSMFAGGFFTTIGGLTRNRIARLDLSAGLADSWDANADGPVLDLALTGGALYASGVFGTIGGQSRSRLASLDPLTGLATSWNPGADNIVRAFTIDGATIYVGGAFSTLAGQTVSNLAGLAADSTLACGAIAVGPATLPGGRAGDPYAQTVSASGGTAPYCYAIASGALPPGLSLDPSSGQIAGTPSAAGNYTFRVRATTGRGCTGDQVYALSILPACPAIAVGPSSLPFAHVGEAYSVQMTASAGTPPVTFSVTSGALPAGLTLTSGGLLSGTPTALEVASFTVTALDSAACSGSVTLTLGVFPPCAPIAVAPDLLADGVAGQAYDDTLGASGGRPPYTWTLASGSLPAGLSLDASTGRVFGTPAVADTFPLVFDVSDSIGCAGSRAYTLAVFGSAPGSSVAADAAGLMITNGRPAVTVPVVFTRAESDSVAMVHVVLQLDAAHLALRTPATPDSSIRAGGWLSAAGSSTFQVTDRGGGAYAVDIALAGEPCGLPTGGALCTLDLVAAGPDGSGTVSVTALRMRDCAGAIVPVAAGAPATLVVDRAPLALRPTALPGGVVGVAYARAMTTDSGTPPFHWSVSGGSLPAGLALNDSTGELSGVPTTAQSAYFTLTASDANLRTGERSYGLSIYATPPTSFVDAQTAGLCITSGQPQVAVPFVYARTDSVPARAVSVTFQLDPARLALLTPATPAASFHPGTWWNGFANTTFFVTDDGGGAYTVDLALLGSPCGVTTGGTLFTVDLVAAGPDGPAPIQIVAVRARDCTNSPIPVAEGPDAQLAVDRNGPAAPADLAASQLAVNGGSSQTTQITLAWTPTAGGTVDLYRAPFGTYPLYADAAARPDSTLPPGGPWAHVATNPAPGYVDQPPVRGVWCYVLVVSDSCGATRVSNETRGTLDYFLADVSDATTPGTGNNAVGPEDVSLLGAHYGITGSAAVDPYAYLDVGPTEDSTPTGRPLPDHQIDFEDLLIFAESYGIATGPPAATLQLAALASPIGPAAGLAQDGPEAFSLRAPSLVEPGADVTATLHLSARGRMQGFSVRLSWNRSVVEPIGTAGLGLVEGQGGLVLAPRPGTVDVALLGRHADGIAGEGDVAQVTFRVLRKGLPDIRLELVDARDASNRHLSADVTTGVELAAPNQTLLLAPAPNPAPGAATITFTLARAGQARLSIYSVSGRLVRTLASGPHAAGVYVTPWDGKDGDGRIAAAGVYYVQFEAEGRRTSRSLVLLR